MDYDTSFQTKHSYHRQNRATAFVTFVGRGRHVLYSVCTGVTSSVSTRVHHSIAGGDQADWTQGKNVALRCLSFHPLLCPWFFTRGWSLYLSVIVHVSLLILFIISHFIVISSIIIFIIGCLKVANVWMECGTGFPQECGTGFPTDVTSPCTSFPSKMCSLSSLASC